MTPDELFTRVHRQRADLAAAELAIDALMLVLTPEQQQQWLAALQTLQATRTQAVLAAGGDPVAMQQSNAAIDRRLGRMRGVRDMTAGG